MHQVGLTQSYASVQEQRIVHIAGRLRYSQGGGVGKFVVASDYEGVKGILRIDI